MVLFGDKLQHACFYVGRSVNLMAQPVRLRFTSYWQGTEVTFESRYSDYGVFALHSRVMIMCDSRPVTWLGWVFLT